MKEGTILVVDDNPLNLKVLFQYLSDEGYRVLVAENGTSAIQQTRQAVPDLVLLDVLMPGINGFETCRRLKADPVTSEIPVIFLTALSGTVDKLEGFNAGGVDYLTKPLQYDEVVARVRTHLKLNRLQQELAGKNRVLEQLDQKKNILLSILAHDLRSPVVTFVSGARILQELTEESSDIHDIAVQLSGHADRLNQLLENLLYWSRLVLQNESVQKEWSDPEAMVASAVALVQSEAERKSQDIRVEVEPGAKLYVEPHAFTSILRNLLSNSIKFTPDGGTVLVAVSSTHDRSYVTVKDTGTGMSAEELERVFNLSRRIRKTGTAGEEGSGLGLILCKEMVEGHGGEIEARSVPGDGSEFTFWLPLPATG
jgi:signal transduction histidine kinase